MSDTPVPGKITLGEALDRFDERMSDLRAALVAGLDPLDDLAFAEAERNIDAAIQNARLNFAEQLLSKAEGRH